MTEDKPIMRNYVYGKVDPDSDKKHRFKVPISVLRDRIIDNLDSAPLVNVYGALTWHKDVTDRVPHHHDVKSIDKVAHFRSWAEQHYNVIWRSKTVVPPGGRVTLDRTPPVQWSTLQANLTDMLPYHESIEFMPHAPHDRDGSYYIRGADDYDLNNADGTHLDRLVD